MIKPPVFLTDPVISTLLAEYYLKKINRSRTRVARWVPCEDEEAETHLHPVVIQAHGHELSMKHNSFSLLVPSAGEEDM